ncbi:hypothetical protein B0H14DRAFT_2578880 [Mycena olivaceomarginata]|nr:hypothetical protein B0H14DRAFT_2578880 [Mycena olivaceomarginata]
MVSFIDAYQAASLGDGELSAKDAVDSHNTVGVGGSAKADTRRKATRQPVEDDEVSDDDYAPMKRAAPRKQASPQKAPPPPNPPATPLASTFASAAVLLANPVDVIRAAKERLSAAASVSAGGGSGSQSTPTMLPWSNLTPSPFSFNPDAQQQQQAFYKPQQQMHGPMGVAAALEANLMSVRGGGTPPTGPRVKSEPGAQHHSAARVRSPTLPNLTPSPFLFNPYVEQQQKEPSYEPQQEMNGAVVALEENLTPSTGSGYAGGSSYRHHSGYDAHQP